MIQEFTYSELLVTAFMVAVIYQIYSYFSFKYLLGKIGKNYCSENGFEFIEIKHAKGHFSVVYKAENSGKRKYQKFRMNAFLGKVRYLEWLK